jgi:hypothetical protein
MRVRRRRDGGRGSGLKIPPLCLDDRQLDPRQHRSDYMPSAKKTRDFVFFIRFASMSFWLGSFWKALAFSILSNAIMIIRFGGVPSMAVMLSVLAT